MPVVTFVRLRRRGNSWQVTLKREIVRALGLRRGDLMVVAVEGGRVVCKRVDENALAEAAGAPLATVGLGARRG